MHNGRPFYYLDTGKGQLYNPFRAGDILMVQQFSPTGSVMGIRQYELRVVTAGVGSLADGENRPDKITYTSFVGNESDVRTRFEVIEGKLQSAMQSVITTFNEKDNYLKNATFQRDMEGWIRERDILFYEIGDELWVKPCFN